MMGWRTEDGLLNEIRAVAHLTRDELATVSRFGIHDLDIEADIHDGRIIQGRLVNIEGTLWLVVDTWLQDSERVAMLCNPAKPREQRIETVSSLTLAEPKP
jgi:hypothetical protein